MDATALSTPPYHLAQPSQIKSIETVIRKTEGRVFSHLNVFD